MYGDYASVGSGASVSEAVFGIQVDKRPSMTNLSFSRIWTTGEDDDHDGRRDDHDAVLTVLLLELLAFGLSRDGWSRGHEA